MAKHEAKKIVLSVTAAILCLAVMAGCKSKVSSSDASLSSSDKGEISDTVSDVNPQITDQTAAEQGLTINDNGELVDAQGNAVSQPIINNPASASTTPSVVQTAESKSSVSSQAAIPSPSTASPSNTARKPASSVVPPAPSSTPAVPSKAEPVNSAPKAYLPEHPYETCNGLLNAWGTIEQMEADMKAYVESIGCVWDDTLTLDNSCWDTASIESGCFFSAKAFKEYKTEDINFYHEGGYGSTRFRVLFLTRETYTRGSSGRYLDSILDDMKDAYDGEVFAYILHM